MVRRAILVLAVVAAPATLMTLAAADAGAGRPAPAPASGVAGAAPAVVQADVTRKARPATARPTSQRDKGWKADDAATPPSSETTPAMSVSLRLTVATGGAHAAGAAGSGARAPPAWSHSSECGRRGACRESPAPSPVTRQGPGRTLHSPDATAAQA